MRRTGGQPKGAQTWATITTDDGVEIFYKDWGPNDAQPLVFHHGWPLTSTTGTTRCFISSGKGYRVVAHDRRGHGRSAGSDGHDMDHYAADAAAVAEHLNLRNAVHIGHSTGGGEVAALCRQLRSAPGPRRQGRARQRRPAADGQDAPTIRTAFRSRCSMASARTRR